MGKVLDNYWLKSALINILQNFSNVFLAFATFYLLIRVLPSKEDYGTWQLFMQTITIMEIVRNGLIQSALVKFIAGSDASQHSKIVTASVTISASLTIVCVILNLLFANSLAIWLNAPELGRLFHYYNIVYILTGILTLFSCIEQANLSYTGIFISSLVRNISFFLYVLYLFIFNIQVNILWLVYAQVVSVGLCLYVSWLYTRKYLRYTFTKSGEWLPKIFNFGKYSFGTSISSILSGTIDKWMLAALFSPGASATFDVAVRVTNLIDIPTSTLATIVFPQSSKRIQTDGKEAIKYLYEKSMGTLMAILIPFVLVVFLFNKYFILILAGQNYADVVPVLNVTLLYCLLIPYGRQFGIIMDSIGKTRESFFIVVLTASTNLVLNFFMIKNYGVIGAAYATLISNVVGFTIAQYMLRKELGVNVLNTLIYAYMFYPEFLNKYLLGKERN